MWNKEAWKKGKNKSHVNNTKTKERIVPSLCNKRCAKQTGTRKKNPVKREVQNHTKEQYPQKGVKTIQKKKFPQEKREVQNQTERIVSGEASTD